jgi:hypothetical protein
LAARTRPHQPRRIGEVSRRHVGFIAAPERLELLRPLQVRAEDEPFPEVEAGVPQVALVLERLGTWPLSQPLSVRIR